MDCTLRLQQAITQISTLIHSLEHLPKQYLTPFADILTNEAEKLTRIAHSVQPYQDELSAAMAVAIETWPPELLNGDGTLAVNEDSPRKSEPRLQWSPSDVFEEPEQPSDSFLSQQAIQALRNAVKSIEPLKTAMQTMTCDFETGNADAWQQRVAHLHLLHPAGRRPHWEHSHDHILAVLASLSLEQDLYAFEVTNGWLPKRDRILASIRNRSESNTQNTPNHTAAFAAVLRVPRTAYPCVQAGLRLGLKLSILQRLAYQAGFGDGVGLLFGFEPQKLARLSYRSFGHLSAMLQDPVPQDNVAAVHNYSREVDASFTKLQRAYCDKFCHLPNSQSASVSENTEVGSFESNPVALHEYLQDLQQHVPTYCDGPYPVQDVPMSIMDDLSSLESIWIDEEINEERHAHHSGSWWMDAVLPTAREAV